LKNSNGFTLPGAIEEVKTISNIMSGQHWIGRTASESSFKQNAGNFKILHLATHGLMDDKNPLLSELLFNSDSINDGFLSINEIYNLKLNAELAVLSACNTGYGEVLQGEGNMSISRAFSYAGCPSVITSLWKVPDDITKKLMVSLYQNLSNNQSKGASLRGAKLAYLKTVDDSFNAHPYYWAGFVLMGDSHNIELKSPNTSIVYWFLGFVFILSCIGIIRNKIKST